MKNFEELLARLQGANRKKLAVVAADHHAIEAAIEGEEEGLVKPIFIGDKEEIKQILKSLEAEVHGYEIFEAQTLEEAAEIGVKLVREGKAEMILKGHIDTAVLLRAVVNKEHGIGTGGIMTHLAMFEVPSYHKLFIVTDGGMVTYPTLEQKKAIIQGAVEAMRKLGVEKPKVACLAAVEKTNPKLPETVDGEALKHMAENGEIEHAIIEGPISFDLAFNPEAAALKDYESPVAGDADIFLVPDFVCGNVLSKSIVHAAKGRMAGLVIGAKVPILLTSRSSSAEEKFLSLAFAAALEQGV